MQLEIHGHRAYGLYAAHDLGARNTEQAQSDFEQADMPAEPVCKE
jgi:hypothetical protein